MNEILVLVSTALVVSLDSFVAGFSLSLNKKANIMLPASAALITLALCLIAYLVGTLLIDYLNGMADIFGATLLACLAITNLLKQDNQTESLQETSLGESLAIGFAVGADAAVATLSLTMEGYGLIVPLFFAVMHYCTVFLGQIVARKIQLKHTNVFSALILIILAIMKVL